MESKETLEEVLGSSMCQFSVIENKLAILYRNQVKIYDAVTKEQQGYSEEDMKFAYEQGARLALLSQTDLARHKGEFPNPEEWFEQFKNQ